MGRITKTHVAAATLVTVNVGEETNIPVTLGLLNFPRYNMTIYGRRTFSYAWRPSCLQLTARTFATNHFNRTFQALSKTFLFGQISRSAH